MYSQSKEIFFEDPQLSPCRSWPSSVVYIFSQPYCFLSRVQVKDAGLSPDLVMSDGWFPYMRQTYHSQSIQQLEVWDASWAGATYIPPIGVRVLFMCIHLIHIN